MGEINLLPEDLKSRGYVNKFDRAIKKVSIFLFSILILICLLGGSAYAFLFYQNKLLESENQKLKSEILALESAEQKLFFLRDRITKISRVVAVKGVSESMLKFQSILESIDPKAIITKFELKEGEINLEVTFSDTIASENFSKYLKESKDYARIELRSYDIADLGYKVIYHLFLN